MTAASPKARSGSAAPTELASPSSETVRYRLVLAVLTLSVLLLFIASLFVGPAAIGFWDSINALLTGQGEAAALVMREIRLPRALLGVMIGATLGLSGAALQGYLRNPLAEPGLLGVTGAASFGAVIAI